MIVYQKTLIYIYCMKSKTHLEWAKTFAELLNQHFNEKLISVLIFGSVATGTEKPDSDIDLLIVLKGLQGGRYQRRSILDPVYEKWSQLDRNEVIPFLSTILKTPEEAQRLTPIYFDMTDRHITIIDKNDFMKNVLAQIKI